MENIWFECSKELPPCDGCEFVDEIKFAQVTITFWKKDNLFFFNDDGWQNYGPFGSQKESLIGFAKFYFDNLEKYHKAHSDIEDIMRKL